MSRKPITGLTDLRGGYNRDQGGGQSEEMAKKTAVRRVASIMVLICAAGGLTGFSHHGRAEPPRHPCESCYVEFLPVVYCEDLQGQSCDLYGCFGGSGLRQTGCRAGMT